MQRKQGRIGKPQEYVEFDLGEKSIIAQESGGNWIVYLSHHGRNAPAVTLHAFTQSREGTRTAKATAVSAAEVAAEALEADSKLKR